MNINPLYENCTLCPRACSVNRYRSFGVCKMPATLRLSRAALHMWEEPFISGNEGSGTVFFTGCNLHCVFCQNYEISGTKDLSEKAYKEMSSEKLADIFLSLQDQKANNINLVTGAHYIPHIVEAISLARVNGLTIPVLYNSSGYESVDSLKMLDGLIDIYLPDFKYYSEQSAKLYSHAEDYPQVARDAIDEMFRQVGKIKLEEESGMLKKGLVVRHLLLPQATKEAMKILDYLYEKYGDQIYISIMSQYTPFTAFIPTTKEYDNLRRKVAKREYEKVVNHALDIGIENAFIQSGESVSESFVPLFKCQGL